MRRLAQLLITTDLLESWLKDGTGGFVPCRNHLPDDAECVGAWTVGPGVIGLIFASEQFPGDYPRDSINASVASLPRLAPIDMRSRRSPGIPSSLN